MQTVAVLLGFVILWLSLRPTEARVLLMALLYAFISLAYGWPGVFRRLFEIRMAIAFGGSAGPPTVYLKPLLETAFYVVPIYGLFVSPTRGRRIGVISFGIILPLMLVVEIVSLYANPRVGGGPSPLRRESGVFSIPHGLTALVLAALWLRIYSCRLRRQSISPGDATNSESIRSH